MNKILEYIRLIIIVAGVLIGIQAPGFVDQYGKALQAHYTESQNSLQEFQDDADKFFGGSLHKLVEHYRNDPDPVFLEGGVSIATLLARNETLENAYNLFHEHPYSAYTQVLLYPVTDIREEVIASYTYTVVLNRSAVFIGLLSGFFVALTLELVLGIFRLFVHIMKIKLKSAQRKATSGN